MIKSDIDVGLIIITEKVLEGCKPCWMYREVSDEEGDSGWRVFTGDESEEYLENPKHFKIITTDELVSIDPEIKPNLLAPVGMSFERSDEFSEWEFAD